ncbi:MAG: four helix bundle protein [Kaiparowitsia implicata GSE-PSE-MK54-09C]|jgi:four helix bundle protein|nr:four helix bundle protein [Kaiparowitsia implicata GSE-PSE-MK54-09C]
MQTFVHRFQDLQVYQLAFACSADLYRLTQPSNKEADLPLAHKLLATSRAVRANIAAAWGKRRDLVALIDHLSMAQLAAADMQIWIEGAIGSGHLTAEAGQDLYDRYRCIYLALDQLMENATAAAHRRQGSEGAIWRATA